MAWRRKIPQTDFVRLQRWCESKVPPHARHEVRIEALIRGTHATLCESRPHRSGNGEWLHRKIFQLRYYEDQLQWGIYHYNPHNGRWEHYSRGFQHHSGSMAQVLDEIDLYPERLFRPERFGGDLI